MVGEFLYSVKPFFRSERKSSVEKYWFGLVWKVVLRIWIRNSYKFNRNVIERRRFRVGKDFHSIYWEDVHLRYSSAKVPSRIERRISLAIQAMKEMLWIASSWPPRVSPALIR